MHKEGSDAERDNKNISFAISEMTEEPMLLAISHIVLDLLIVYLIYSKNHDSRVSDRDYSTRNWNVNL